MPLKLDLLDGAELETDDQGLLRVTRMALATGLDTSQPWKVLLNALYQAGCPQTGQQWQGDPKLIVNRHLVRSVRACDQASVAIIFERDDTFDPLTKNGGAVIEDSTHLSQEMVSLDRLGVPIRVTYTAPSGRRYVKSAEVPQLVPIRTLTVTTTIKGKPSSAVLKAAGTVNLTEWQGLPKGWWMFLGVQVIGDFKGKSTQVRGQFLTRNRDWSEFAAYRDDRGDIPKVDSTWVNALRNSPYGEGVGLDPGINGISKWALYYELSFEGLFGF
jgi:hypothetical protein